MSNKNVDNTIFKKGVGKVLNRLLPRRILKWQ